MPTKTFDSAGADVIYNTEFGDVYSARDFLAIARGNARLAGTLLDLVSWENPETKLEELVREGDVVELAGIGYALADGEGHPAEDVDALLEDAWRDFGDVAVDDEDALLADWRGYPAGTSRFDVWHDFDRLHSIGVHTLLFP